MSIKLKLYFKIIMWVFVGLAIYNFHIGEVGESICNILSAILMQLFCMEEV